VEDDDGAEATLNADCWSVQYHGPATYVQVNGLQPGRRYAVRVACKPVVSSPDIAVKLTDESETLLVSTPPTVPGPPAAPILASRQRSSLKVKGRRQGSKNSCWCFPQAWKHAAFALHKTCARTCCSSRMELQTLAFIVTAHVHCS
jgi:hypothetical protein